MLSALRLFKALPIPEPKMFGAQHKGNGEQDAALMKQTVTSGFVFSPKVLAAYPNRPELLKMVEQLYGRNPEQLNQTFHKSWEKVRTASMKQLMLEQMLHYLTTYGFESTGYYDQAFVYIPAEKLDVPQWQDNLQLVVIRGLTKAELKFELLQLLKTGVALSETTVKDALDIATFVGFVATDLQQVTNREVKAALYDYLNLVPDDPVEFLRFVTYRATGKTLLIKNPGSIKELKAASTNVSLVRYFQLYEQDYGLARLAQIFYRFKPLFLAMRTNTTMRQTINQLRRLAVENHRPMKPDALNDVTKVLLSNQGYFPQTRSGKAEPWLRDLDTASTFRKIRLLYALQFRTTDATSIVYHIRNGKSWATDFNFPWKFGAQHAYEVVLGSIVADLALKVAGKTILIPEGVQYALPATEKQFSGNIPSGTCVVVKGGMVAGVHWENQKRHGAIRPDYRIDLDLSLQSIAGKLGWDAGYRSAERDVLFSGDMTDAPVSRGGASELYAFTEQARGQWLVMLNYYNFDPDVPVPFQILVGQSAPRSLTMNYTIDPNLLVAQAASNIDVHQKIIGLVVADDKSCRFYFSESDFGSGRSSRMTKHTEQARDFMVNRFLNPISLNEILAAAGAEIVTARPAVEPIINLSLEAIDKLSLISLLSKA